MVFLVTLAFSSDPVVWFFLNASFGFFISLMGVSVNAAAVMLQKQISINVMGRMHAGWSLGAVAAAISGGLATVFLSLEAYLLIVGVLTVIIFEFNLRWLLSPAEDGHLEEKATAVKRRLYQMPAELRLLAVGLFFGIYPEVAIIDWAAVFAKDILNVDVALRSIPFAAFMTGMIAGRLSMTSLARKMHPHTMASRGAFLAAITLSIAALTAGQLAALNPDLGLLVTAVFWGLAGLGLAPVAPAFFSAAGHIPGVSTAWAVSSLSLFNALISIVAKTTMGALSEGVGLSLAFFFPIVMAVGSGLIASNFVKRARRNELDAAYPATGPISIIVTEDGAR
jgi:fucose permease